MILQLSSYKTLGVFNAILYYLLLTDCNCDGLLWKGVTTLLQYDALSLGSQPAAAAHRISTKLSETLARLHDKHQKNV